MWTSDSPTCTASRRRSGSRGQRERPYDPLVPAWLIWAIVAALLSVGEIFTPGLFFLGPVALAAVAAAIVALIGVGVVGQLLVFIIGSIATVALLRPIARRHLHMPAALRTGTAALEGKKAVVLQRVDANGGRVRIGGEEW